MITLFLAKLAVLLGFYALMLWTFKHSVLLTVETIRFFKIIGQEIYDFVELCWIRYKGRKEI